jgi:hypothetical protein
MLSLKSSINCVSNVNIWFGEVGLVPTQSRCKLSSIPWNDRPLTIFKITPGSSMPTLWNWSKSVTWCSVERRLAGYNHYNANVRISLFLMQSVSCKEKLQLFQEMVPKSVFMYTPCLYTEPRLHHYQSLPESRLFNLRLSVCLNVGMKFGRF